MPEPEDTLDGNAVLSEQAQRELKRVEEVRASLEEVLENERTRRRNRWLFYGAIAGVALLVLPILAVYCALVLGIALRVAEGV